MLEKDIENLIASYPDEVFPNEGFQLVGQQVNVEGKRIDILFKDKVKRHVIVEVKRGILTREASGQVAEYFGLLKSRNPNEIYELVLCANVIPKERKVFLEHIGIECKELGISFITDLAARKDYSFIDDRPSDSNDISETILSTPSVATGINDGVISVWIFQGNPNRYDVLNSLSDGEIGNRIHWLVNQHRKKIKKGHIGLIWMSGAEAGIYAITRIENDPAIMTEFDAERKYWFDSSEKKEAVRVEMTILKRFINKPIFKNKLRENGNLKDLSILRQFQGTNFPVRNSEWRIISELL
jgi:hypothetical protein